MLASAKRGTLIRAAINNLGIRREREREKERLKKWEKNKKREEKGEKRKERTNRQPELVVAEHAVAARVAPQQQPPARAVVTTLYGRPIVDRTTRPRASGRRDATRGPALIYHVSTYDVDGSRMLRGKTNHWQLAVAVRELSRNRRIVY